MSPIKEQKYSIISAIQFKWNHFKFGVPKNTHSAMPVSFYDGFVYEDHNCTRMIYQNHGNIGPHIVPDPIFLNIINNISMILQNTKIYHENEKITINDLENKLKDVINLIKKADIASVISIVDEYNDYLLEIL